jgi:predicted  nucleic acid-binding Zn-ribbon protein
MLKYAKKQVELKEEEIADLKDRLVGLGQAKELEKEILQKQLNDLKNEIHDLRERYEAENSELRTSFIEFSPRKNFFFFRKSSRGFRNLSC